MIPRAFTILAAVALLAVSIGVRAADPERVAVRAGQHAGYIRLVFDWPAPVGHSAAVAGKVLRVSFDRALTPVLDGVRRTLGDRIVDIALDEDGRTVTATMKQDVTVRSFAAENRIVVDLTPARANAASPVRLGPGARDEAAPATAPARAPVLNIRTGHHRDYGRLVFEWPERVEYTVDRQGRAVTIRFAAPAAVDIPSLRKSLPDQMSELTARQSDDALEIGVTVREGAQLRYFRNRGAVVFDVVGPVAEKSRRAEAGGREETGNAAPAARRTSTKPLPPPLVSVDARRSGTDSEIRFNWREPVPAAVFSREGTLWVVFGRPARFDLAPLRVIGGSAFANVGQNLGEHSVHVRLPLGAGFDVAVRREGTVWIVTMGPGWKRPAKTVGMKIAHDGADGAELQILTGQDNRPITVRDPDIGDTIVAVTTSSPGVGMRPARRFAEFELLQSEQGVAVRPLADAVRVRAGAERVVVHRHGGLSISSIDEDQFAAVDTAAQNRLIDLARWRFGPIEDFRRIEQKLIGNTLLPKGVQRNAARLGLARFYIGHGMGAEAHGVVAALLRDDPTLIEEPAIRVLRGIARYITRLYALAEADFEHPSFAGEREVYPWRAGIAAARGDWAGAYRLFRDTNTVIAGMPPHFAVTFGLLAAEAALSVDDLDIADARLTALAGLPANGAQMDQMAYLRGHLLRKRDSVSRALAQWRSIVETGGREGRAKARFAEVTTELSLNMIEPGEAIMRLEKLRFAWRNGVFEFDLLETLGRLYAKIGDLRSALVTLREAATYFKDVKGAQSLTADMRDLFRKFYLDGGADALRPVVALGLYQEFRELTPSGEDGDRMIRKLSERLIDVDLLEQAAELLDHQVRFRLAGEAKAETGTRLAQVLLMDGHASDAAAALDNSAIDGIPAPLARERRFLRARALLGINKPKDALATIAGDHDVRFDLLRAQIHWRTAKWDKARLVLARLTGGYDPAALDDDQAELLLRRAVALRLAQRYDSIDFLRERFAEGMKKTPRGDAFMAIVGRPVSETEDFEVLARQAAELDTFVAFLDALSGGRRKAAPAEVAGASG